MLFLDFLNENVNKFSGIDSLKKFIVKNELIHEQISENIITIFDKIDQRILLDNNELLFSLEAITNNYFRHLIVHSLFCLKHSNLSEPLQKEIEESKIIIEDCLKTGEPFPQKEKSIYTAELLNFQKLWSLDKNLYRLNDGLFEYSYARKVNPIEAVLAIHSLVLLKKLPQECLNDLCLPKILENINNQLKQETGSNSFLIFAEKAEIYEGMYSFWATDGEKLAFISKAQNYKTLFYGYKNLLVTVYKYKPLPALTPSKESIYTNVNITTYHNSNQKFWNAFSKDLIENFQLSDSFEESLIALGKERQKIAQLLDHGRKDEGKTSLFGRLRYGPGTHTWEGLLNNQGWKQFYTAALSKVEAAIEKKLFIKKKEIIDSQACESYHYPDAKKDIGKYDEHFRIILCDTFYGKKRICVQYPIMPDKQSFTAACQEMQGLYEKIRCDKLDNVEEFIKNLARFSFKFYRQLFLAAGNNSVCTWFVCKMAFEKQIMLIPKNNEKELPLDFQAFFTFNIKEYEKWFLKNAYYYQPIQLDSNDTAVYSQKPTTSSLQFFSQRGMDAIDKPRECTNFTQCTLL